MKHNHVSKSGNYFIVHLLLNRILVNAKYCVWIPLLVCLKACVLVTPTIAQVIPDTTLGAESSQLNSNVVVPGGMGDRIEGGALRGVNLFHSFSEFNVNAGQRIYFANPTNVQNIFSRVTGGNLSNINGTLGVDGIANLFLLNPNGILFGPNARLDIRGSFLATTANSLQFPGGLTFGATNPQGAPLLTINVPVGLQYGTNATGVIQNRGRLSAGQDLTLAATNLDLQGQLQAGQDLNLQAQDTVQIRDTTTEPFVARSGRNLTIQGNQLVDILTLNHLTQTPFVSGGHTTLISHNPISADAHFTSGGNFATRTLDGRPNNLRSLFDPIITVGGNYAIGNYTGASLLVTAGGNISFGDVAITAIDPAIDPDFPVLRLNAGGNIIGTGTVETTVVGGNLQVGFTSGAAVRINQIFTDGGNVNIQAQGEITTGEIITSDLLNDGAAGSVNLIAGGDIRTANIFAFGDSISFIDSDIANNNINLQSINGSIFLNGAVLTTSNSNPDGFAGNISLEASRDIEIVNSTIESQGNIGQVFVKSTQGSIRLNNSRIDTTNTDPNGVAGDITIDAAQNIEMVASEFETKGNLGLIFIGSNIEPNQVNIIDSTLSTDSQNVDKDSGLISIQGRTIATVNSKIETTANNGRAGDILIQASAANGTAIALTNTTLDTAAFGILGQTGGISLNAVNQGDILLQGGEPDQSKLFTDIYGSPSDLGVQIIGGNITIDNYVLDSTVYNSAIGNNILMDGKTIRLNNRTRIKTDVAKNESGFAGQVQITGDNLFLAGGSQISAILEEGSSGQAGDININVRDAIALTDKETSIANSVQKNASGKGGQTRIQTNSLLIKDGARIESSSSGVGDAGDLIITARDGVLLQNGNINSDAKSGSSANAGNIVINTDRFSMSSPGSASINTRITGRVESGSQGNGGNITINALSATIDNSAISFSTSSTGNAGILTINARDLTLQSDAAIVGDVGDGGSGRGGEIRFNVAGTFLMDGATGPGVNIAGSGESTRITAGIGPGGSGQGGDIQVRAGTFLMQNGAIIKNSTRGQGNAGAVRIDAEQVDIAGSVPQSGLPSGLFTSTSTDFRAGDITINTGTFRIRDGGALNAQSVGNGAGGNITVTARSEFEALAGGQLVTSTSGAGAAGNITVNARQVTIAGQDPFYTQRLAKFPNPLDPAVANAITETGPSSGLFANAIAAPTTTRLGKGGDISITADRVFLRDNAGLKVDSRSGSLSSDTTNSAGTIKIQTNRLTLDNNAFINAETDNGSGGNIQLAVRDLLVMRRNSVISTTAGSPGKGGNGGNLEIKAPAGFLVTALGENNDIIANAFGGRGGKIAISAFQIIGFKQQSRLTPSQLQQIRQNRTSDISASSDVGADGQVSVQTLNVDPSQGLAELEVDVIDPSDLISQECRPDQPEVAKKRSEFVITGRGGLPPGVDDPQMGGGIAIPWVQQTEREQAAAPAPAVANQAFADQPLIEAQGITIAPDGTPLLTAQAATATQHQSGFSTMPCRDRIVGPQTR